MRKQNKRSNGSNNGDDGWRDKIHSVDLSRNDEAEIVSWLLESTPQWQSKFAEILDSGYALKISPPGKGNDYWFSATCRVEKDPWYGHTFTVKYPDLEMGLLYITFVLQVWLERGQLDQYLGNEDEDWIRKALELAKK